MAIVLVLGLVPTCVSFGVVPVAQRMAAPLACPSETVHTVVMARWGGMSRGGRSLHSELYCLDANGHGTIPSNVRLFFSLLAVWGAISAVILLALRGLGALRARGEALRAR